MKYVAKIVMIGEFDTSEEAEERLDKILYLLDPFRLVWSVEGKVTQRKEQEIG